MMNAIFDDVLHGCIEDYVDEIIVSPEKLVSISIVDAKIDAPSDGYGNIRIC